MSSVHANNVVDLVTSPSPSSSPMKQMSSPMSRRNNQRSNRKRRSPRLRNGNDIMVSSNNDNGKMAAAARSPEVIDLLADLDNSPSLAGLSTMNNSMTKMRSGKKRRRRPARSAGIINLNDGDNDIVEIIEPSSRTNYSSVAAASSASASTYTAAASMKQPQQQSTSNNNMNLVERIREVFPLVSRAKVETFLSMAKSYSTDESNNDNDENVFLTVMTVLSEDPLGTSISDATFAAAAVHV